MQLLGQPAPALSARNQYRNLLFLIVTIGIAFRLDQYFVQRTFSTDECMLLLNVISKSLRQLMGPLDRSQAAPPMFLAILRGSYLLFGDSELSLRAWSLACSIAAFTLFAALAWRLLSPPAAMFVVTLMALSDRLVWHAVEAKQYSGDVLMCIVLLWIVFGTRWTLPGKLWCSAIVTAIFIWLSHPLLFVFAAISLAMLSQVKKRRQLIAYLMANGLVLISAGALYTFSLRIQRTAKLAHMWDLDFVPWHHPLLIIPWLIRETMALANYPLKGPGGVCLFGLAIVGVVLLVRAQQYFTVMILIVPALILLLTSAADLYPFGGNRLTLFYTPMLLLLSGTAIGKWQASPSPGIRRTWWMVPAVMIISISFAAVFHVIYPEAPGPLRPALTHLRSYAKSNEGIYVIGQNSAAIFAWYSRRDPWSIVYREPFDGPDVPLPFDQFWLVGMYHPARGVRELAGDLKWANQFATETGRMVADECVAVHFHRNNAVAAALTR